MSADVCFKANPWLSGKLDSTVEVRISDSSLLKDIVSNNLGFTTIGVGETTAVGDPAPAMIYSALARPVVSTAGAELYDSTAASATDGDERWQIAAFTAGQVRLMLRR